MAGSKLNKRVAASSILEVIIAMITIVVIFGIAMMIYTNVLRMSLSVKKIKAEALLLEALNKADENIENVNQSNTVDDIRIEQEIKAYDKNTGLLEIDLTAYDQNQQKIAEIKKVITNRHD